MLVTPESTVMQSFGNFIYWQTMMSWLDRIVVDECQVVLDLTSAWGQRMFELERLVRFGAQQGLFNGYAAAGG
jgi:hypothetical protein